jgi:uncharacterized RDD family membrane protein YckC
MFCGQCGQRYGAQERFCQSCGAQRGASAGVAGAAPHVVVARTMDHYAGFGRRLVAYFIDSIVLMLAMWPISAMMSANLTPKGTIVVSIIGWAAMLLIFIAFSAMESSGVQATPGKMLLGIVVTDNDGQRLSFARALGRNFAKIISLLAFGIGFLLIALNARGQGLHDLLAGTFVVAKQ